MKSIPKEAQQAAAARLPKKVEKWGGLLKGDMVQVRGRQGDFLFLSATVDAEGVTQHLDLVGPRGGRAQCRSILPSQLA